GRSRRADGPLRPEVACRPWGSRRTDAVEGVVETVEGRVLLLARHAVAVAVPAHQAVAAGRSVGSRRSGRPRGTDLAGRAPLALRPGRSRRTLGAGLPGRSRRSHRALRSGRAGGADLARRPLRTGRAGLARLALLPRWSLRSRWSRRSLQRAGGDVGAYRLHLRA